jgi:lytic cellulose monooxygenase (C1-hydroxylating)
MKSLILTALVPVVYSHALFQQLWVDGVDKGSTCVRLPGTSYASNSPVTNVASNDVRCNVGGTKAAASKCTVEAGGTVTVEMHQQNGDRGCNNEAIGGSHYGPVMVYMSKVADSSKADGSSGWFKSARNVKIE